MPRSKRLPIRRGVPVRITFEGRDVQGFEGETVATALLAAGEEEFGYVEDGSARQPLCNMGTCFDCAVTVNDVPLVRACLEPVQNGMCVRASNGARA